jgi:hypothetical protein
MSEARYTRILTVACVLAFAVRLGAVIALQSWDNPRALEHDVIAYNLVEGRGFSFRDFGHFGPTSVQSPTYPPLLALLFEIFGTGSAGAYAAALGINCVLGALTVAATAGLARGMGASPAHALTAAALVAVWPTQVYAATTVQAVVFITLCAVWMSRSFLVATRSGELRPWLAYSASAVVASLTEPSLLLVSAASGLAILLWRPLEFRVRLRNAAVLLGAALLIIGPWTLRNYRVHGTLVPVKSTFWVNVWKGANDHATGTDRLRMSDARRAELRDGFFSARVGEDHGHQYAMLTEAQVRELTKKTEVEREAIFRRYATDWIRANPGRYFELCAIRLRKSLWIDWDNPRSHNAAYVVSRALLLLLSIPGLYLALRNRWRLHFPLAVMGSCLLLNTLTLTGARFAIPHEPFQLALGSATVLAALAIRTRAEEAARK